MDDPAGAAVSEAVAVEVAVTWPLSQRPGFLARRMHQIHVSLFSELCGAFRITPLQYSLLSTLQELGEADQTTLANAVVLDRTTTTGALKRLAARGLVTRTTSLEDRRAQLCRITPEGQALHAAMEEAAHQAHARTVASLDPADRALLIRLLGQVIAGHDHRRTLSDPGA
jgi:DNA-binding MarR family transcriptional regulator